MKSYVKVLIYSCLPNNYLLLLNTNTKKIKMKKTEFKLLFILIIAQLYTSFSHAQSIYFNYTDGTNAAYNLADIRKITFDVDLMQLHMNDGSIYSKMRVRQW